MSPKRYAQVAQATANIPEIIANGMLGFVAKIIENSYLLS